MRDTDADTLLKNTVQYPIPQGSDTMTELAKCVRFIEEAVATT